MTTASASGLPTSMIASRMVCLGGVRNQHRARALEPSHRRHGIATVLEKLTGLLVTAGHIGCHQAKSPNRVI